MTLSLKPGFELAENHIFMIRDRHVMVDRDLASLYGVETKLLNQAVKRNIARFPEQFLFNLTNWKTSNWSQIVTGSSV